MTVPFVDAVDTMLAGMVKQKNTMATFQLPQERGRLVHVLKWIAFPKHTKNASSNQTLPRVYSLTNMRSVIYSQSYK